MGCLPWLCPGYYKKTKRSRRKTQETKHKHKRRAKDKKKTIPQPRSRAEQNNHQIELPEAQWQETQRVETSPVSILTMASFDPSAPSPIMGQHSGIINPLDYYSRLNTRGFRSPSPSSDQKSQKQSPQSPVVPTTENHGLASPGAANARGPSGTVYVHPHSMAHAHFLVVDYTKPHGPPATYSALIPTGGQISDLVAALAHPGAELWARTDFGCRTLQDDPARGGGGSRLYALHREACQLELWPAPREKPAAATATATAAASERVRKLEKELEAAKKKERDEAKKKGARRVSRSSQPARPAAVGSSDEAAAERGAPGWRSVRFAPSENKWLSNSDSPTTRRLDW